MEMWKEAMRRHAKLLRFGRTESRGLKVYEAPGAFNAFLFASGNTISCLNWSPNMLSTKRAAAPVKVRYNGYTSDADEWIASDRIQLSKK